MSVNSLAPQYESIKGMDDSEHIGNFNTAAVDTLLKALMDEHGQSSADPGPQHTDKLTRIQRNLLEILGANDPQV